LIKEQNTKKSAGYDEEKTDQRDEIIYIHSSALHLRELSTHPALSYPMPKDMYEKGRYLHGKPAYPSMNLFGVPRNGFNMTGYLFNRSAG